MHDVARRGVPARVAAGKACRRAVEGSNGAAARAAGDAIRPSACGRRPAAAASRRAAAAARRLTLRVPTPALTLFFDAPLDASASPGARAQTDRRSSACSDRTRVRHVDHHGGRRPRRPVGVAGLGRRRHRRLVDGHAGRRHRHHDAGHDDAGHGHRARSVDHEARPGRDAAHGDTAAKVTAAAKAALPGATVIRVETDSGGAVYEAHMQKADGTRVTLKFDSNFKVTATRTGFGSGPGGHGDGQAPPSGTAPPAPRRRAPDRPGRGARSGAPARSALTVRAGAVRVPRHA